MKLTDRGSGLRLSASGIEQPRTSASLPTCTAGSTPLSVGSAVPSPGTFFRQTLSSVRYGLPRSSLYHAAKVQAHEGESVIGTPSEDERSGSQHPIAEESSASDVSQHALFIQSFAEKSQNNSHIQSVNEYPLYFSKDVVESTRLSDNWKLGLPPLPSSEQSEVVQRAGHLQDGTFFQSFAAQRESSFLPHSGNNSSTSVSQHSLSANSHSSGNTSTSQHKLSAVSD